jgi:uncharacterized protein YjbI with pentapeptide repeats
MDLHLASRGPYSPVGELIFVGRDHQECFAQTMPPGDCALLNMVMDELTILAQFLRPSLRTPTLDKNLAITAPARLHSLLTNPGGGSVMTTNTCLAKKDLSHVNLSRDNLAGADLHESTLRNATLQETNLEEADLTQADLTHADLGGASLRHATAAHANLEGADLRDADLTGANLRGARLVGAKLRENQRATAASAGAALDDEQSEDTDSREN